MHSPPSASIRTRPTEARPFAHGPGWLTTSLRADLAMSPLMPGLGPSIRFGRRKNLAP